jgi:hypothetical protein
VLNLAFRQGLAGYPLQLDLLLSETPLAELWEDNVTRTLLEPAQIGDRLCHRVRAELPDGAFVFWIDRQDYVLRRVEYPMAVFAPNIASDVNVREPSLTVEFRGASLQGAADPHSFTFQMPKNAKRVRQFVPPPKQLPSQLFGKQAGTFAFTNLAGGVVSDRSLGNRIKVLVWFNNHPACRTAIGQINQVARQFKDQQRMTFCAVCTEPSSVTDQQLAQLMQLWQIQVPVTRDLQAFGRDVFHIPWAPTLVVLDEKNAVQIFEVGANPHLAEELPQVLERLLAGDDLAAEILEQFRQAQAAYQQALENGGPNAPAAPISS